MDIGLKDTIQDVSERFGGRFSVEERKDWKRLIEEWDGDSIHLTMYGTKIDDFFSERDEVEEPLVIVGAEKVPREVYELADHNVSVGDQPHSEVAALAVFMDRYNKREIPGFSSGTMNILPSDGEKRVIDRSKVPSTDECFRFAREQGMDDDLMAHTMEVMDRALHLQNEHGGDLDLIIAGSLLHDIGRTVTHDVDHGVEGSSMVEEKGWDEEIQKIVERHIGGGVTEDEAREQGLPARDHVPETLEERIVCHADNTAGGMERFEEQIKRTKRAGYLDSAERMIELAEEFGERISFADIEED